MPLPLLFLILQRCSETRFLVFLFGIKRKILKWKIGVRRAKILFFEWEAEEVSPLFDLHIFIYYFIS